MNEVSFQQTNLSSKFAATQRQLNRLQSEMVEEKQIIIEQKKLIDELDAFAHTVAHDLQTPLTLMIGCADVLVESYSTLSPAQVQELLQTIAQTRRKMSKIITELLLLAEIRDRDVSRQPLDMGAIVVAAQERLAGMIAECQAEIIVPDAWPVAVGYAPWIEEVWANYLSNGLKYGGLPQRLELGANIQPDGMVRFWVRDNGPGLTLEEQNRLFIPFAQLAQSQVKGHGLGLSIVYRIINRKSGGYVGVESTGIPGQGSLFYFTLPGYNQPKLKQHKPGVIVQHKEAAVCPIQ